MGLGPQSIGGWTVARISAVGYDSCQEWGEDLLRIGGSESYVRVAVNPVERRIQELSKPQRGRKKCYIQAMRLKVVVPNQRYSWLLLEHPTDTEPTDTVVLDVDLKEALTIDRQVGETLREIRGLSVLENLPPSLRDRSPAENLAKEVVLAADRDSTIGLAKE